MRPICLLNIASPSLWLLTSLSSSVGAACMHSHIHNPPASAIPPRLSRMAIQPADMAQRLKAAFPRELIGRPAGGAVGHPSPHVEAPHFAIVKSLIATDGHVTVLRVLQSSHPAAAQSCSQVLTESVWQPALDKGGKTTTMVIQYRCVFEGCENWDCNLQLP